MEKEKIIREVVKIIKDAINPGRRYKIVLFGSTAKGDNTDTSDIDVGILADKKIPFSVMVKIREQVEEIKTLRKIDVVDFNSMGEDFKTNALKGSKLIGI